MLAKLKRQGASPQVEQDLVFRVIHGHGHKPSVVNQQISTSSSDESMEIDETLGLEQATPSEAKVR